MQLKYKSTSVASGVAASVATFMRIASHMWKRRVAAKKASISSPEKSSMPFTTAPDFFQPKGRNASCTAF